MQIMNQEQTKLALASGVVANADCVTAGAVDLPDGHRNAERVLVFKDKKTGKESLMIGCPWLLCDILSV